MADRPKPAKRATVQKARAKETLELEQRAFASAVAWARWLSRHHDRAPGIWLRLAKRASGIPSVTYAEALEHALCYGWIDGQARGIDASWYMQRFTPRAARSIWSKINCAKALALIDSGAMQPAGLAEVERATAYEKHTVRRPTVETEARPDASVPAMEGARPCARRCRERCRPHRL